MAAPIDTLPTRLSSFVGREREIVEVAGLLSEHRLVTLVGAPGVGKTRLALRIAEAARDRFADGAAFVELAGLAEADLVPRVIASTLGVEEQAGQQVIEALITVLRGRSLLVVLDNCEHLIEASASVVETLLGACPRLHVLATSREALRCEGEVAWRVPSLTVPAPDSADARSGTSERLLPYEAVRLFVDRAQAVRPSFALTAENAAAICTICHDLDGIPLALELAAARVVMLSPKQIAARLDGHLGLLTSGARTALRRQQTLEATIDWSYRLLSIPEQTLLRRLAVFAGGWSIDAAEAICADPDATPRPTDFLDVFSRLVDKSLVQVDAEVAGEPRYRLLEMIRQYAFERLVEAGEVTTIRNRHRDRFIAHVERSEPLHYWAPTVAWLDRLEADHDNLRAALDWCLVGPGFDADAAPADSRTGERPEPGLRLILALFWPWFNRNHMSELRWWYDSLLAAHDGSQTRLCARAMLGASLLATHQRQMDVAIRLHAQGSRLAVEIGDQWATAWATELASHFARVRGEPHAAAPLMEEALRRFEEVGDRWGVSWALRDLGSVAIYVGDFPRAQAMLERSLEMSRAIGDDYCASLALDYLGTAAYWQRDLDRAVRYLEEGLKISRRLRYGQAVSRLEMSLTRVSLATGDVRRAADLLVNSMAQHRTLGQPGGIADGIERFAEIAEAVGELSFAAQFIGTATAVRKAHSAPRQPVDEASHVAFRARVETALGADVWVRNLSVGATMPVEQAIQDARALALRVTDAESASSAKPGRPDSSEVQPLTRREHEVAALVARGLTNRQIADRLVVSRRTIDAHVASILARLGFSTRAQIAVWAASRLRTASVSETDPDAAIGAQQ